MSITILSITEVKLPIPHNENVFLSNDMATWEENLKNASIRSTAQDEYDRYGDRPSFQLLVQWFFLHGPRRTKERLP